MSDDNSAKVQCKNCGVHILRDTSERTGGLCMPCSQGKDPKADRSMGALKANPMGQVVIGVVIMAFGVIIYLFLSWFESSGDNGVRLPWFIAIAYMLGGKTVVSGIFIALGIDHCCRFVPVDSQKAAQLDERKLKRANRCQTGVLT